MSSSSPPEGAWPADGIVIINKPAGWTSHDVVARLRRLLHLKRVGHAGTLDPAATGVLPICFGQATRLVDYLSEQGKAYRATITFGIETDTYDAEGNVTARHDLPATLDEAAIAEALPVFQGEILQVPPVFSALKRDGQRMYDLARQGIAPNLDPRPVRIDAITIVNWSIPDLVLDVVCGKGTYIRSLAFDLGRHLGSGAHLKHLVRTRVGHLTLQRAVTPETLGTALVAGTWENHLLAPDEALLDWSAAILGPATTARLLHGQLLDLQTLTDPRRLRAYSTDGQFLGIIEATETGAWRPTKVLQSRDR